MIKFKDTFSGSTQELLESTKALLELDASGSLIPHGIGGSARELLNALASRLAEREDCEDYIATGTLNPCD